MSKILNTYIVTHKQIEWEIPFNHKLITVGDYKQIGALHAADYIGKELNDNRTFAFYRGVIAAIKDMERLDDKDYVVVCGYRTYFGNQISSDIGFAVPENKINFSVEGRTFRKIVTPDELTRTWQSSVMLEVPEQYELIISRPLMFNMSVMEQYASCHHLDDLMFGVGCAIRAGLLTPKYAAQIFSKQIFINQFAGRVSFFRNLYERVWWIAKEFFAKHYIPREGYQERAINFMIERIVSAYLMEKIYIEKLPSACSHLIHIDKDSFYVHTP